MRDAEPVIRQLICFRNDGDGAGGEGAFEAGGGDFGFQQPIHKRAFAGAGAAEDADDRRIGIAVAVEMKAQSRGIALPAGDRTLNARGGGAEIAEGLGEGRDA